MPNKTEKLKKLDIELNRERRHIKTDNYPMSIGEVINNFKLGEINLSPAYQRLYRWKNHQKTKFIESIFLGIPIPAIFVSQQKNGTWDVVDGVQRLSTILEFVGELSEYSQLKLTEANLLTSLDGLTWDDMSLDLKRVFRKSKLNFNIILTENSIKSQYELFQRLNTGGTELSEQEIRNCLLIMLDPSFYEKINELKNYENFSKLLKFNSNDERIKKEYPMELIVRYFIARLSEIDYEKYNHASIVSEFLDNEIINIVEYKKINLETEINLFKKICDFLYLSLEGKAFRKYYEDKDDFRGAFSSVVFDLILSGISLNFDNISHMNKESFIRKIKEIYFQPEVEEIFSRGVKPIKRFKLATEFSKKYFSDLEV
jgi:uncharacterized protein with ParB-like and HNH nuclease domain